ncbi:cytochrome c oxidase subunit 4 [Patulibacter brassicae]|jgi:hypothetical protein|uniref:cytochrome-c oxidase n=1 Tax=Patulibacter brassicae TaxID=1705717 RepID=A0ABU4VGD8_9ACTN|nr:cytochrome c oxidase subunit 4 [Patulibacter brassicae]MDX8150879.1 cytochrome c oxidase subunit 4 [Patulibacter brassicae]
MSDLEKPIPPAGDEIHLPGNSAQPLLLTVGVTTLLVGLTTTWWLIAVGLIVTIGVLVAWIRDTIRETNALPLHHDEH